ncbi:hypothetical protein QUF80_20890 [Desulfococcaceae bacterium HSG8]|nr:hypothetical protein [Desulfococcaceae bacterium HSG8]
MGRERRKLTRFMVQEKAFVAVGFNFPKIGRINDISRGGLAFEYLTDYARDKAGNEGSDSESFQATIFLVGEGFRLNDVPCVIVYDVLGRIFSNSFILKRRCGVKFGRLTETQRKELNLFLAEHTTGLAR